KTNKEAGVLTMPMRLATRSRSSSPFHHPWSLPRIARGSRRRQPFGLGAMTPTYTIRLAEQADIPAILDLTNVAAKWLQACKDTDQWARPWPDEASRDARVEQGIKDGLTWIVEDSPGMLAATVTCREHGNDTLWSEAELAEDAVYVSRLIVSRELAGHGIGAALIDWAGALGIRQRQAKWKRVDVGTPNLALHDYYRGQGFDYLRTVPFQDYWDYPSAALFQKATTKIDGASAARFKATWEAGAADGGTPPAP